MGYTLTPPNPASAGPSAQRPNDPPLGWSYFETDTKRQLLWTGAAWLKTNGPTEELLVGSIQAGGQINNGTVGTLADVPFTFPAGVYGPVTVKGDFMWTSNNNAAAYVRLPLLQGTSVVDSAMETRLHNHASGYGVFQHLSMFGTVFPPGPGSYTARMEISVDPGGAPFFCYDNRVWLEW